MVGAFVGVEVMGVDSAIESQTTSPKYTAKKMVQPAMMTVLDWYH